MKMLLLPVLLLLLACAPPGASPILDFDCYGAIAFGSPVANIERLLGERAQREPLAAGCERLRFARYPLAAFLAQRGRLLYAEPETAVVNSLGLVPGMRLEQLRVNFTNLSVLTLDGGAQLLVFEKRDRRKAFVGEAAGGRLLRLRAGLLPSVLHGNAC